MPNNIREKLQRPGHKPKLPVTVITQETPVLHRVAIRPHWAAGHFGVSGTSCRKMQSLGCKGYDLRSKGRHCTNDNVSMCNYHPLWKHLSNLHHGQRNQPGKATIFITSRQRKRNHDIRCCPVKNIELTLPFPQAFIMLSLSEAETYQRAAMTPSNLPTLSSRFKSSIHSLNVTTQLCCTNLNTLDRATIQTKNI